MEKQFETNPFLIAFEVGAKNGYQNTKPKVTNQFIKSWKYVIWRSEKKKGTCETCKNMDGKLLDIDSITTDLWPAHPNCACKLEKTVAIASGTLTEKGMLGIDNKFIICDDKIRRNILKDANRYKNDCLPYQKGRIYYTIEIEPGGRKYLILSNDGLCFVTLNNFKTIYPVENEEIEAKNRNLNEEKYIEQFQKELSLLEKGNMAPMAYTYIMKNVYDWYLSDDIAERKMIENQIEVFRKTGYKKTGIDFYDNGIKYMPSLPEALLSEEEHFFRNHLNIEYEWSDFEKLNQRLPEGYRWKQMGIMKSIIHQNTAPFWKWNRKYVSFDGYFEAVYSYDNQSLNEETASEDMGTYNYGPSTSGKSLFDMLFAYKEHYLKDMLPYFYKKNTKKDYEDFLNGKGLIP